MARRNVSLKKRGTKTKKERATYLVVAEGKNKTETLYLSNFQVQGKDYYLRFVKAGNNTDAESLYKTLTAKWKELGLSSARGDKGFVVLDLDNDSQKVEKNLDCYDRINDRLAEAYKNTDRLRKAFEGAGWPSIECNPMTDMAELVRIITG